MDFTLVIPTYNGAKRLSYVLEKIKLQQGLDSITAEIIVVDNNSQDDTKKIIKKLQQAWTFSLPLCYSFEPRQGLAHARYRGVLEAKGELVGFIDDDNFPDQNWVLSAYRFGKEYPRAGAFSGRIIGQFEVDPPEDFHEIAQFLAIRDHGAKPRLFEAEKLQLPPGASLVIRKTAWLESVPLQPRLTGRVGNFQVSGEDYEALLYIYKKGWEIWYNPDMLVQHYIFQERLTKKYLLSLARGAGLATCHLRVILVRDREKPLILLRTLLGNLRRIIMILVKYNVSLGSNLKASFNLAFFWGGILSPFYYFLCVLKCK
jgi:glycosyltransferase involved in cell wall biosynthesis